MPKFNSKLLNEIVNASIEDALTMSRLEAEAEREKKRQVSLEDEISKTVGSGKSDRSSLGSEADEDVTAGGPTREKSLDLPSRSSPPESKEKSAGSDEVSSDEIDADAIIDKFNIIRSGRSMNDRDISTAMTKLINTLKPDQRSTMFKLLQHVGTIVAPNVDSGRLTKPPEEPSAITAQRLQMLQKRREDRENAAQRHASSATATKETSPASDVGTEERPSSRPPEDLDQDNVEDTSPPIRVGKRTAESIRMKLKQIL